MIAMFQQIHNITEGELLRKHKIHTCNTVHALINSIGVAQQGTKF